MKNYQFAAPCLMGVERILSNELKFMGASGVHADNGRVFFEGGAEMIARANIRSRIAERILLVCARFEARTFEQLFDGVRRVNWSEYLPENAQFPVSGSCLSSQLRSVSDCQSIIKKAVADSLAAAYHTKGMLPETGSVYKIRFLILKDNVCVMLDTTGEPLHKRGYRANANDAPMKETLAAAIVDIAGVRPLRNITPENADKKISVKVIDPCCGSGTLVIEAAQKALNIAPGISRSFISESWELVPAQIWEKERQLAREDVRAQVDFTAVGRDIDAQALRIARENAEKAGVADYVSFENCDLREFALSEPDGDKRSKTIVVCNPPYGERLLDITEAEALYAAMGERFVKKDGASYHIICPDDDFERFFKRRADKRRKLYNGMISCCLYQYM